MKFTKLYEDVKASDLFKSASEEEVAKRKEQYSELMVQEELDNLKKTKLSDGTWHVHESLDISEFELKTLKNLNVSIVDGDFYCGFNDLTSLEGAPKIVYGDFLCGTNMKDFTKLEVLAICDVKGFVYV